MFKKKNQNPAERNAVRERRPTLERSVGTSVFSYHANRSARPGTLRRQEAAEAPVVRAKRNFRSVLFKRSRAVLILVLVLAAVIANLFLSRTPNLVVVTDTRRDIFLHDRNVYQTAASQAVQASFFNTNKLTINTAAIEADLRAVFPELAVVSASVPFIGNTVHVYIEPASPQLLLASGTEMYVLDDDGRAVVTAGQAKYIEKAGLPIVTDESGLPITTGKPALPSTSVAFITEVVNQLRAKNIDVASLTLPAGASQLDVRITGESYFIKFNLQGKAREEVGTYLAVKAQLDREKKKPGTYIDVRVEERAYYK